MFNRMYYCKKFRNLPIDDRIELIVKKCLRNHGENEACSVGPCQICKSSHSILLCEDNEETASILIGQPPPKTINKKVDLPEKVDETLYITEEKGEVEHSTEQE